MADFERACEALAIPLHVLPPRRPQWNGRVERANRSARIEFWNRCGGPPAVSDIAPKLLDHEFFHNHLRPHTALDCRTPNEYLVEIEEAARSGKPKFRKVVNPYSALTKTDRPIEMVVGTRNE